MRINGVQRQMEMATKSASEWPEHKVQEAQRIFRETATISDESRITSTSSTRSENISVQEPPKK